MTDAQTIQTIIGLALGYVLGLLILLAYLWINREMEFARCSRASQAYKRLHPTPQPASLYEAANLAAGATDYLMGAPPHAT